MPRKGWKLNVRREGGWRHSVWVVWAVSGVVGLLGGFMLESALGPDGKVFAELGGLVLVAIGGILAPSGAAGHMGQFVWVASRASPRATEAMRNVMLRSGLPIAMIILGVAFFLAALLSP